MAGTVEDIIRPIIEGTDDKDQMIAELIAVFEDYEPAELDFYAVFNPAMRLFKVRDAEIGNIPPQWVIVPKSEKTFYTQGGTLKAAYRHLKTWRP